MRCPIECQETGICQLDCSQPVGMRDDCESAIMCLRAHDPNTRIIGNVRVCTLLKFLESACDVMKEYEELLEYKAMYKDLCK